MNTLGIFVKHPQPGRVKTRLANRIGADQSADLYSAFLHDVAARFRACGERRSLCYWPDTGGAVDFFRRLGGRDYQLWPQPAGSLGERMRAFFDTAFAEGAAHVVVIGSDSPTLPKSVVDEAFTRLEQQDCVLGPATDGGYYLIGFRGRPFPVFEGIQWSGPQVLEQTVAQLPEGARFSLLAPWYDVDTLDDVRMLRGHLLALQRSGSGGGVPATSKALNSIAWD